MALYGFYGQQEIAPLRAFAAGLILRGHRIAWRDHNFWTGEAESFDAVVIFGLRAQGRDIALHYQRRSVPLVVIDHGYMKRVHRLEDYGTGFFQVGIGRLGWVPSVAPDAARFESLGIEVAPRRAYRRPSRALILGQVAWDASHHFSESRLNAAYCGAAGYFEAHGLRVRFRGHPLASGVDPGLKPAAGATLAGALADADVVFSLNSNAGLDAIIAGVPAAYALPCHYSELGYRWPVTPDVILPPDPDRVRAFLRRLAWAQWTADEMSEGKPQAFLASLEAIP